LSVLLAAGWPAECLRYRSAAPPHLHRLRATPVVARFPHRRGRRLRDRRRARPVEAVQLLGIPIRKLIGPVLATAWIPRTFSFFPTTFAASGFIVALASGIPVTILTSVRRLRRIRGFAWILWLQRVDAAAFHFRAPTAIQRLDRRGQRDNRAAGPSRILVFQDPTLFPWATVWNNVATGLDARGALAAQRSRVDPALDIVGLRAFACLSRPAGPEDFWVIASALVPLARRPHYLVAVRPG
jgi:hypothetical protein